MDRMVERVEYLVSDGINAGGIAMASVRLINWFIDTIGA